MSTSLAYPGTAQTTSNMMAIAMNREKDVEGSLMALPPLHQRAMRRLSVSSPCSTAYPVTCRNGLTDTLRRASQLRMRRPPALRDCLGRGLSSHLVTKRDHAALVRFDLRQVEGDVSVELLKEWDPITNQYREDRIAKFVG